MCDYCKDLYVRDDEVTSKEIGRKKVMDFCGECFYLDITMESYPKDDKHKFALTGCLSGGANDFADRSLVQIDIKYCPFCGRKLDN